MRIQGKGKGSRKERKTLIEAGRANGGREMLLAAIRHYLCLLRVPFLVRGRGREGRNKEVAKSDLDWTPRSHCREERERERGAKGQLSKKGGGRFPNGGSERVEQRRPRRRGRQVEKGTKLNRVRFPKNIT